MRVFQSVLLKTDVTALKITEKHVLAGVGDVLKVFLVETRELLREYKVFDGDNIQGIALAADERILVFGGCNLSVISSNVEQKTLRRASDWILTGKWLNSDTEIATVSMHNVYETYTDQLELKQRIICDDKCILYSAFICSNLFGDLLILSGTVFSEIIIWKPLSSSGTVLNKLKGHNGVIFSIDCDETRGFILTTSDDRSTILWQIRNQDISDITLKIKVFGHQSRVFRCKLNKDCLITAGEDSLINLWNFQGDLLKKFESSQGGSVWALDCNETIIAVGGANCGIRVFPINTKITEKARDFNEIPKHLGILCSSNLAIITDSGILYYYVVDTDSLLKIKQHDDLKSYCLLQVSKCRKQLALAGFQGQIYIYHEISDGGLKLSARYALESRTRIFAFHWLTCSSFVSCQDGGVLSTWLLNRDVLSPIKTFFLPPSKERSSTSACLAKPGLLLIGDRKGNVHVYKMNCENQNPVFSLRRVQNHLGVTRILNRDNKITVLGRNGALKTFTVSENHNLSLLTDDKLSFNWLADMIDDLIAGFTGKSFVLFDYKSRRVLFEKDCGGGHRSWDLKIDRDDDFIFSYIKDRQIRILNVETKSAIPADFVQGYHSSEINSLKILNDRRLVISGGEDTTLRVSLLKQNQFRHLINLKSHLSSVRCVCFYEISRGVYLVFSGGGRGQIICWKLSGEPPEMVLEASLYEPDSQNPETRVMDLKITKITEPPVLLLIAACSDGSIKTFAISQKRDKFDFILISQKSEKRKCITKIELFGHCLISFCTDGSAVFYSLSRDGLSEAFGSLPIHQSGVNACHSIMFGESGCLLLTGGDDNAVCLNLLRFPESSGVNRVSSYRDFGTHCAQVSGVYLMKESRFFTVGLDQRLAAHKWAFEDGVLKCQVLEVYNTSVADIHGMEVAEDKVLVYGKGVEVVKVW